MHVSLYLQEGQQMGEIMPDMDRGSQGSGTPDSGKHVRRGVSNTSRVSRGGGLMLDSRDNSNLSGMSDGTVVVKG